MSFKSFREDVGKSGNGICFVSQGNISLKDHSIMNFTGHSSAFKAILFHKVHSAEMKISYIIPIII